MTPAVTKPVPEAHEISIRHEPASRTEALVFSGGHRAHCSCGWGSDCYAQLSDTQRAIEVHLRRSRSLAFDALIKRSSIGAAIKDIKTRGIDAHLVDLEREMSKKFRRPTKKSVAKRSPEDAAFLRGFALAIATIWRCHHDGQMVQGLLEQNKLTLADFRGLDIDGDVEMIRQAVASRRRS